jgi:uncharacterized caspase-like protein
MMEFVFRRFPADCSATPPDHELWLIPAAEALRKRRDLARLAADEGPGGFLHGAEPIHVIHVQHDPTLDDMLAAVILERQLAGQAIPAGVSPFCEYAKIAREGRRPGTVPIEVSLEGIHTALRNLAGSDLGDPLIGTEFGRQWRVLAERIFAAAGQNVDPFQTSIVADDPAFANPRSFLQDQKKVYRQDVENGERWIVRLPDGPPKASGLMLRQPKSLLWKHWARSDEEAPVGGSYLFTAVLGEDGNWIFSTDPVHRQSIKGLADVLQAAELRVTGEEAKDDPWFDGKPFGHTLVAPPKRGSKLRSAEVLKIARQWAGARKARPPHSPSVGSQWAIALVLVAAIAAGAYVFRPQPIIVDGVLTETRPTENDKTFTTAGADKSPLRLYVLSIGISEYAKHADTGDTMNLTYPARDAVQLNQAFAAYTGSAFIEMNRTSDVEFDPQQVVRARVIAEPEQVQEIAPGVEALPPTREGILEGLVWLEQGEAVTGDEPTDNDLAIITVSGHGLLDAEGEYYLLTREHYKGADPRIHGISFQHDIAKTLNRLKCTVVIILDTCHAGGSTLDTEQPEELQHAGGAGDARANLARLSSRPEAEWIVRGAGDPDEMQHIVEEAKDNFLRSPRGVLVLPACRNVERAAESHEWKHGALSLAVLEALEGKVLAASHPTQVQLKTEGMVAFEDIEFYASNRVPELTNKQQLVQAVATGENVLKRWIPMANRSLRVNLPNQTPDVGVTQRN